MQEFIIPVLIGLFPLALVALIAWRLTRIYRRYRGRMLVTCPETHQPAGVRVDARHAAVTALGGDERLRLTTCTRWPERQGCGQECLAQIEAAPAECLVRRMLNAWFHGKACALCGQPFGEIRWHDHKPALADASGEILAWPALPVDQLPRLLATHQPICWNCQVAEGFRREHPERVIERPRQHTA